MLGASGSRHAKCTPTKPNARMDLVVHIPGRGVPVNDDFSIASAASIEALEGRSDTVDGKAATIAAEHKRTGYPLITVTPFIIEDHRRFGAEAIAFVKQVAPVDPAERTVAIRTLYHRLSSVLQRCAADAVLAAVNSTGR